MNIKSKKVAGVSINTEILPTRKQLVRMALNTKTYQNNPNALELINKEIEKSGLFRGIPAKSKARDKDAPSEG